MSSTDDGGAEAPEAPEATDADEPRADEPEADVPEADEHRGVLDELTSELGDAVLGSELSHDDLWVRVDRGSWRRAAEVCRSLGFDYFCFLSGIDWMPGTSATRGEVAVGDAGDEGNAAEAEAEAQEEGAAVDVGATDEVPAGGPGAWETGVAGGETRFQLLARLYSTSRKLGITLKADLDDERPQAESWAPVYDGADWHERETWEMFGFDFLGHPHLAHLYLPGEFEGFPLRKDFALLSREVKPWPGLVDVELMPEGADGEAEAAAASSPTEGGDAS